MKGKGHLQLQAAWSEGRGRKTIITLQDLTGDSVLREGTGSHETKKLRDSCRRRWMKQLILLMMEHKLQRAQ